MIAGWLGFRISMLVVLATTSNCGLSFWTTFGIQRRNGRTFCRTAKLIDDHFCTFVYKLLIQLKLDLASDA